MLALADATRRNYVKGNKAFTNFCLQLGLLDKRGLIFPSEENLMYFAAHCAGVKGLSPSTIHNYLYGIRSWSINQGLPDPLRTASGQPLLRLARVLRGIKKCHRVTTNKRLPITSEILRALNKLLGSSCFGKTDDSMMLAAINLAFFAFLRCGEFTIPTGSSFDATRHLSIGDIFFYPNRIHPISMTVRLKYSKTDPFGRGQVITLYSTGSFTCPVMTMQRYLSSRSWLMDQPLFITREGKPLTRNYFICLLRDALSKLGFASKFYSGHSFRIGAATTAAAAGLQDWLIRALGRWSSDCYKLYIRMPSTTLRSALLSLASCPTFNMVA